MYNIIIVIMSVTLLEICALFVILYVRMQEVFTLINL